MKKSILRIAIFSLLAVAIAVAPTQTLAQEKKEAPKGERKQGAIPFGGKVGAIDKAAKTLKVGERTFQITSETKIMKAGKPATLDDGAVGDQVGGSYTKGDDGKLTAKMVRFGPKPEGEAKGEGKKEKK